MEVKTPWNPSKKAIARVKDPLPIPTICRYCNGDVRVVGHAAIYNGRTYGEWPWVYRCECCGARVGMHPYTNLPLGTLADDKLREVRNVCKKPFEQLWQGAGIMGRTEAYRWLAEAMRKPIAQCHFGLFDESDCERARQLCEAKAQSMTAPFEIESPARPCEPSGAMAKALMKALGGR